MRIQILGPLFVEHEDQPHDIGSAKSRTILAMLSLGVGLPVTVDQLVDELWPDSATGNARNALQANIVRLRKRLSQITGESGDQIVRTTSIGYVLALPSEAIDAQRFLTTAERGSRTVSTDPVRAAELLGTALRMWRGPALLDVAGGPRCRGGATSLDERRLAAREDLIAAKLATGAERVVVSELRQLVTEHPEREKFSEQLMLALYRSGRQAEAVDTFHYARRWLDTELGLAPGRGLSQLYHRILNHDHVLG